MKSQKQVFDTPLSVDDLIAFHDAVIDYFNDKHTKARQNERRFMGKNWREDQEQEIKAQDRIPYSMPVSMSKINIIRETMRNSRTGFKLEATIDPQDEIKAELATIQIKDYMKRNKFKDFEADIFDYGFAVNFGVSKLYLDHQGYYPVIKSKLVDHYNFVWDRNAIDYNLSDALWVAEIEKMYRYQVVKEHPDANIQEGQNNTLSGRYWQPYYITKSTEGKSDFDIISVFHHFQKVEREYHCLIVDDDTVQDPVVGEFRNKKDAEKALYALTADAAVKGNLNIAAEIVKKTKIEYDYYKFTYDEILQYEQKDYEQPPYNVYFAIKIGDDYTTFTDFIESPQIFIDRLWSQIDYSLGTDLKKVLEVNVDQLEMPIEQAMKILKKGGVIPKHGFEKIVDITEGSGINTQYLMINNELKANIEDMGGGRSFQGLSEGPESGIAINQKRLQGQLVAGLFIDNFYRWKHSHGENVIRWIRKFETKERTIRVAGGELTQGMMQELQKREIFRPSMKDDGSGYVTVFKQGDNLTYLDNFEYELTLVETELSESERTARYYQMIEQEKTDPMLLQSPTWRKIKLGYNPSLTESEKQLIMQEIQAVEEAQARMAQEEMNLRKAEVLSKMPIMQDKEPDNKSKDKSKDKKK